MEGDREREGGAGSMSAVFSTTTCEVVIVGKEVKVNKFAPTLKEFCHQANKLPTIEDGRRGELSSNHL